MLWVFFSPNAGKYGPEKTPYFDIFQAVFLFCLCWTWGEDLIMSLTKQ